MLDILVSILSALAILAVLAVILGIFVVLLVAFEVSILIIKLTPEQRKVLLNSKNRRALLIKYFEDKR